MKHTEYKASALRFAGNLVSNMASFCVMSAIAVFFVFGGVHLAITGLKFDDRADVQLFLAGAIVVAVLGLLLALVVFRAAKNRTVFPGCLCYRVDVDDECIKFMFVGLKSKAIGRSTATAFLRKEGIWLYGKAADKLEIVFVDRRVFRPLEIADLEIPVDPNTEVPTPKRISPVGG